MKWWQWEAKAKRKKRKGAQALTEIGCSHFGTQLCPSQDWGLCSSQCWVQVLQPTSWGESLPLWHWVVPLRVLFAALGHEKQPQHRNEEFPNSCLQGGHFRPFNMKSVTVLILSDSHNRRYRHACTSSGRILRLRAWALWGRGRPTSLVCLLLASPTTANCLASFLPLWFWVSYFIRQLGILIRKHLPPKTNPACSQSSLVGFIFWKFTPGVPFSRLNSHHGSQQECVIYNTGIHGNIWGALLEQRAEEKWWSITVKARDERKNKCNMHYTRQLQWGTC